MDYITNMDELMKRLDEKKPAAGRLVTENPTPNTQRLYDFLLECRGKRYISGQQYLFESEIEDLVYYRACGYQGFPPESSLWFPVYRLC